MFAWEKITVANVRLASPIMSGYQACNVHDGLDMKLYLI